jgi:hypothetical protein
MTTNSFLDILDALRNCVDPRTGETFKKSESCLGEPEVRRHLSRLIKVVAVPPEPTPIDIPDKMVSDTCIALRELGYAPCVAQLAKIFIGSRSIADHSLKGLLAYNRYRGVYTRDLIHTHLMGFHRRFPEVLPELPQANKRTADEPWKEIDFFRRTAFDKLEGPKEKELAKAVLALGLRKEGNKLPAYMHTARETYPRAFEPWVRGEQVLLIEAMCYSNDLKRLSGIFGRSARSLENMGQRLIFESKRKQRNA